MNPATPHVRIPVGVVIERRKSDSPWIDFIWCATAVLPGEPDIAPWTVMRAEGDVTEFYLGGALVTLHGSETARYRENLLSGSPGLWVVLAETGADPPYQIMTVTADSSEGEGLAGTASNLVEQVPMPDSIRDALAAFVAEYHVEQPFFKRTRKRADPEALARRDSGDLAQHGYGDHDE